MPSIVGSLLLIATAGISLYVYWDVTQAPPRPEGAMATGLADAPGVSHEDLVRRVRALESQVRLLRAQLGAPSRQYGGASLAERMPEAGVAAGGDSPDAIYDEAENAVMEALESYNPQIRDRLRAVVQEEQEQLRE